MKRFLLMLFASAFLIGCTRQSGTFVNDDQLAQFRDGYTTLAQIEETLGAPTSDVRDSSGLRTIAYSFMASQVKGATFVPVVGAFAGGATAQVRTVVFQFDDRGILVRHTVMSTQSGA